MYCSYIVRFNTDKIDIGFYHVCDLFTLDCTAHNTHNYVKFYLKMMKDYVGTLSIFNLLRCTGIINHIDFKQVKCVV